MAHEHAHGGGHHHHGVSPAADRRWLAIALATVLAFMVVEVVAGVLASSLALLSDAAHMLTDAGAIALALVAARLAAVLMLASGWRLLWASGRVLLEAAPHGVDPAAVGNALAAQPGVVEVHDLHVWEVTSGFPALAAHVLVRPGDDCHATRRRLQEMVGEHFGIDHVTLQVDHAPAA